MAERKHILLRLDPAVHDALAKWAADDLRSTTAQIELVLRRALSDAGRLPSNVGGLPRRGRPKRGDAEPGEPAEPSQPPPSRTPPSPHPAPGPPPGTER